MVTPFRLTFRARLVLVGALAVATAFAACSDDPSCEAVCDNVLDKCGGAGDDVAGNACLEECRQRTQEIPSSCEAQRDDVLVCLADAESVDCNDPLVSAACTTQADALVRCAESPAEGPDPVGAAGGASGGAGTGGGEATSTTGSSSTTTGPGGGTPCESDDDCPGALCSWKFDVCTVPAPLGEPCGRDAECQDDLCSWVDEVCSVPVQLGEPCGRDVECQEGVCNWKVEVCTGLGASGDPCGRDGECVSGTCGSGDVCD